MHVLQPLTAHTSQLTHNLDFCKMADELSHTCSVEQSCSTALTNTRQPEAPQHPEITCFGCSTSSVQAQWLVFPELTCCRDDWCSYLMSAGSPLYSPYASLGCTSTHNKHVLTQSCPIQACCEMKPRRTFPPSQSTHDRLSCMKTTTADLLANNQHILLAKFAYTFIHVRVCACVHLSVCPSVTYVHTYSAVRQIHIRM